MILRISVKMNRFITKNYEADPGIEYSTKSILQSLRHASPCRQRETQFYLHVPVQFVFFHINGEGSVTLADVFFAFISVCTNDIIIFPIFVFLQLESIICRFLIAFSFVFILKISRIILNNLLLISFLAFIFFTFYALMYLKNALK